MSIHEAERPFASIDAQELRASRLGRPPPLTRIAHDTWMLGVTTTSRVVPYSLAYLITDLDGGVHIIDPGTASEANWTMVRQAVVEVSGSLGSLRTVTSTHLHHDHFGLADHFRMATGARLVLHRVEQEMLALPMATIEEDQLQRWGVPESRRAELRRLPETRGLGGAVHADLLVDDHELLPVPGKRLRVISSPGHTRGHMCIRDEELSLLFTGDHLLPGIHPGVGLGGPGPTNPLGDYLASLEKTAAFDLDTACPGHGYRFTGVRARSRSIAEHHLRRNREVLAIIRMQPHASTWEVASQISWSAGWSTLRDNLLGSALRQVELHATLEASND